jgi:hypothetical protein
VEAALRESALTLKTGALHSNNKSEQAQHYKVRRRITNNIEKNKQE